MTILLKPLIYSPPLISNIEFVMKELVLL